jgi:cytochrome c oxidase subunit I+III
MTTLVEPELEPGPPRAVAVLARTWASPKGLVGRLSATNHQIIGLRFVLTAFGFFLLAGIEAMLMRAQLAGPQMALVTPEQYSELFTMHGTTMMFFFAVPMWEGIALYLVPLMIGARETAFPRMNAFAYWVYLLAGLVLYGAFLSGAGPDSGWFSYPTLSLREYSPSLGVDVWALAITFLEFSALAVAVSLIVTIFKHRAPGMAIHRMPIFVWAMLVVSVIVVFAMPALVLATMLLALDRGAGTHFFNPANGGDPVLWQHLFWWFGHPEVYIIFLPGMGVIASMLPSFTRRELVGYPFVVLALVATGFISFAVWAHHMFASGLPTVSLGYFSAATIAVGIPTGVQIFAWLATVWTSHRLVFRTPFLFSIGFVVIFVFGGISGVMLGSVPLNWQVHDTHFVVAHFHYVLLGGMVFPMLAALHFWFPKVTGRMLDERLGKLSFWLIFAGVNVTFFPLHVAGLLGMPRRIYTYPAGIGLDAPNLIASIGAAILALGVLAFMANVARSRRHGAPAGNDPWRADTLEWATTSPPPSYNFAVIPSVAGRAPLWTHAEHAPVVPGHAEPAHDDERIVVELRADRRETQITTFDTAEIEARNIVAGPSIWPFLAAISAAIGILGIAYSVWLLPVGAALGFITIAAWHWPEPRGGPVPVHSDPPTTDPDPQRPVRVVRADDLPVAHTDAQAPLFWGMILFITIEAVFFGALLASYFFLRDREPEWPPGKTPLPDLRLPITYTIVLIASSIAMHTGDKAVQKDNQRLFLRAQTAALLLAVLFLVLKGIDYAVFVKDKWYTDAYGSLTWTMSGFHAVHVLSVVLKGVVVLALGHRAHFNPEQRLGVQINGIYWHFVVVIWLPLFFTIYLYPWLLQR